MSSNPSTVELGTVIPNGPGTNVPLISNPPEAKINNMSVVIVNISGSNNSVISFDLITPFTRTLSVSHTEANW